MKLTPLTELRLGATGRPTLAVLAKRIKTSAVHLSGVEKGYQEASEGFLKKYAAAVGATFAEVQRRYIKTRLLYHTATAKTLRKTLAGLRA